MDKRELESLAKRLAAQRGGHVSFDTFIEAADVSGQWLRGQTWWRGWNNFLSGLGLQTKTFGTPKTPLQAVATAVAALIEREGRWPTDDQIRRARKQDSSFPSLAVVRKFRQSGQLANAILDSSVAQQFKIAAELVGQSVVNHADQSSTSSRTVGYVYMERVGKLCKIGRESVQGARQIAARTWVSDSARIHTIATDDPEGIERYWHDRFTREGKHVKRELFRLDSGDIAAFKKWKRIA